MSTISFEKSGAVVRVTIGGESLGARFVRELRDAFEAIGDDAGVRAVVMVGGGDAFAADWDASEDLRAAGVLDDPFGCVAESPKAVVAAINGDAIGGGLALALAADIRIAGESARFGLPEVSRGMIPVAGATQRLVRLVGRGDAAQMVLSGETIDAAEALRIGLVSEVVLAGEVLARATAIAERIAERGPIAVQYAKEAVTRGLEMSLEQALRFETDLTVILQTTEDRAEGVRAFLEKRKPEFKGR